MAIVMGTAGHIDHGKTTLIHALTGIQCDRLAEEKKRGITIELGFAWFDLPDKNGQTIRMSIIDVPGHEKFIKNMVAGAQGIDFVLLVIAADEGVMPQTREHIEICSLLNIQDGIIALKQSKALFWNMPLFSLFLHSPAKDLTHSRMQSEKKIILYSPSEKTICFACLWTEFSVSKDTVH